MGRGKLCPRKRPSRDTHSLAAKARGAGKGRKPQTGPRLQRGQAHSQLHHVPAPAQKSADASTGDGDGEDHGEKKPLLLGMRKTPEAAGGAETLRFSGTTAAKKEITATHEERNLKIRMH